MKQIKIIITLSLMVIATISYGAGQAEKYSLQQCIEIALENSTDIRRTDIQLNSEQSILQMNKAAQNPNLSFNGNQNNSWDSDGAAASLSLSLNSSVTIYNGAKLRNAILQSHIGVEKADVDIQTETEIISLQIMAAYIDLLYAKEQLKSSEAQLESTSEQLAYTLERKEIGVVNRSEYLNMKSQYATDKATLIESESSVTSLKVTLMQLMNVTIDSKFDIEEVAIDAVAKFMIDSGDSPESIYNRALNIQPSIKSSQLNIESYEYDIEIAKASKRPVISADANVGTSVNSSSSSLGTQLKDQTSPSIGISLSVPIYQRKVVENNITQAELQKQSAELDLIDTQNSLRKSIELAYTDYAVAKAKYDAAIEQLTAQRELFSIAEEMFSQQLTNATDFIIIKNDLVDAENSTIQAKYELVLQAKYLAYYKGDQISLNIN